MATPDTLAQSVIRHSIERSPALAFELGIGPILDEAAHQVLRNDLQTHATPWEKLQATDGLAASLPDDPGLYMFVWRPTFGLTMSDGTESKFHQILYIGQAGGAKQQGNTLRNRYKDYRKHLRGNPEDLWVAEPPTTRAGRLTHFLTLRPLEFWFTTVGDRSLIENLESRLINLYNPPANTQKRPRLRGHIGNRQPALRS